MFSPERSRGLPVPGGLRVRGDALCGMLQQIAVRRGGKRKW